MSQPPESYPAGPLPERDDLKKNIWKIVDDIGAQNLSVKMLRKRLEAIYKIEFTSHKVALEELVLEKLKEEPTQIQLAKAAKAQEEGLVSAGKGKKKTRGSGLAKKTPKKEGKSESKRAKTEKKPDNYPKAAQTAYFIFSGVKRPEIPSGTSVTETAKLIGEAWKNLSDDEKAAYKVKADEDKARFQRDMDAYIAAGGEVIGRATKKGSKKAKKENNGPKRAMSGYFFFTQAKRSEVQSKNPELKITEIAKVLGSLWKEMSDEDKKPFEEQAAADKERYVKECAAMGKVVKTSTSTGAKRKRKAKSESDSSDSSDSDSSDSSDSDSSDSDSSDSSDSSSSDSDSD